MISWKYSVTVSVVITLVLGFLLSAPLPAQQLSKADLTRAGTLENINVHSASLEDNKLGDPVDQPVGVYLPPSYRSSPTKRYPALYLLHGFDSNIRSWTSHGYQDMNLQD